MLATLLSPASLQRASLALAIAAVAACAPDFDRAQGADALIVDAHPGLAVLPSVTRLAVRGDGAVEMVSGRLGTELADVAGVFELSTSDLHLERTEIDVLGYTHERFSQTRNGLPVVSGDLAVTRDKSGELVSATGTAWDEHGSVADAPAVAATAALELATTATAGAIEATSADLVYIAPSSGGNPVLAWQTLVIGNDGELPLRDLVFVNAINGTIVDRHPQIHTAKNRLTNDANNQETLGQIARTEGQGATGDTDIDRAHDAAGETYDCLLAVFGRDSYDGAGATLNSVAHFGQNVQNAFWTGNEMIYGDGFAVTDVGTHEFGHAVTERTSNLVYQNESGALNEASSDILSAVCNVYATGNITVATWMLGEDLPIGAIRNMADPITDGISSDHYTTRFTGPEDNGGVHLNSGIANLQFVLMVTGGGHPRRPGEQQTVGLGIEKAGQIFFRALTTKMGPNTTFIAARTAYEVAAGELYGEGSSEQVSVSEAFNAVGVGGPPGQRPEPEDPTDPDPNDPDPNDPNDGTPPDGANFEGGCNSSGSGAPSGLILLGLIGLVALVRRRRD